MKTFRFIGVAILAIALCVNFTACDDDEENVNMSELIGLWEPYHAEGYETGPNGFRNEWNEEIEDVATNEIEYSRLEFLTDGEFKEHYYYNGWHYDGGRYQVEGSKITIFDDEDEIYDQFNILLLNEGQLVIESKEKEDGYEYYEKISFRRVK